MDYLACFANLGFCLSGTEIAYVKTKKKGGVLVLGGQSTFWFDAIRSTLPFCRDGWAN